MSRKSSTSLLKKRTRLLGILLCALALIRLLVGGVQWMEERRNMSDAMMQERPIGSPRTLFIPRLRVETSVEPHGRTTNGDMDVPKGPDNVAWYKLGPKPGERGSAVIAGHLDTVKGTPAVFWDLKKLQLGDTVYVQDDRGTFHGFRVSRIIVYDYTKAPLQEIFGQSEGRHLNLITCNGAWNEKRGTYNERIVVYTDAMAREG